MPATSTGSRSVASTESNASSQGSLNSGEDDLGTPHQPHPAPVARDPAREAELLSSHLADGVAFGRLSGQYKDLLERALKSEESDGKAVEEHEVGPFGLRVKAPLSSNAPPGRLRSSGTNSSEK